MDFFNTSFLSPLFEINSSFAKIRLVIIHIFQIFFSKYITHNHKRFTFKIDTYDLGTKMKHMLVTVAVTLLT